MKVKMFAAVVAALAIPALSATTGHVLVIPTITYSGSAGVDWFDDHLARDPNWIDGVGGPIDLMRPRRAAWPRRARWPSAHPAIQLPRAVNEALSSELATLPGMQ
jgi:hypothetical protein